MYMLLITYQKHFLPVLFYCVSSEMGSSEFHILMGSKTVHLLDLGSKFPFSRNAIFSFIFTVLRNVLK